MNLRRFFIVGAVTVALQLLVALWGFSIVGPDAQVPIHWNATGEANGYGPAWIGFLITPVISIGLIALFGVLPRIEPRRANLLKSGPAYMTVAMAFLGFMLLVHAAVVAAGAGYSVPITGILGGGMGLLFAVLGNVLTTVRSNYMFGVRTPWTLTSDLAWDKTHRLVGRIWVGGGLLIFLASLLGRPEILIAIILLVVIGGAVLGIAYSYQVWRNDPNRRSLGGDAA
jgi:uncharacterized membrane protein